MNGLTLVAVVVLMFMVIGPLVHYTWPDGDSDHCKRVEDGRCQRDHFPYQLRRKQ